MNKRQGKKMLKKTHITMLYKFGNILADSITMDLIRKSLGYSKIVPPVNFSKSIKPKKLMSKNNFIKLFNKYNKKKFTQSR